MAKTAAKTVVEKSAAAETDAGIVIPDKIETRAPAKIPDINAMKSRMSGDLEKINADYIRDFLSCLFKFTETGKRLNKRGIIEKTAEALCFQNLEIFNAWFFSLPPLIQGLLWYTAFKEFIPVVQVEKKYGISLLEKAKDSYEWRQRWSFKKDLKLDFFLLASNHGSFIISVPRFLRTSLRLWLVPPREASLEYCARGMEGGAAGAQRTNTAQGEIYNNSIAIAESFPLFCGKLKNILGDMVDYEREKMVQGFKKRDISELLKASNFLPFPLKGDQGPNSADLAARFIMLMNNYRVSRPEDGYKEIQTLVMNFFSEQTRYPKQWYSPDRNFLECALFLDHLTKTAGYFLRDEKMLPPSRTIFKKTLHEIAVDGRSFDAEKLAEQVMLNNESFFFCERDYEESYKIKADTVEIDGVLYDDDDYYSEFRPKLNFRSAFICKPVFKAYLYLFASLGLLEITQKIPPLRRTFRGKQYPLTPYDSLDTVRITEFGRWCLGLTDKPPVKPDQNYEAIADRELFLVTIRGNSLERRLYLDRIGQKLGEDRWRISPGSFISDCVNKKEIEERISGFKRLIDPKPAAHWETLFNQVLSRAGLFDLPRNDVLVYSLPADRALRDELLQDPALKSLIMRCEGNMLVVASKNVRKFFIRLAEHGIAHFS
jgi:hypothetical protein